MKKRPFYTALGFIVWKASKLTVKRKVKSALPSPEVMVATAVFAGVLAGGAAVVTSGDSEG